MIALIIISSVLLYGVGLLITYHFWLALSKKHCERENHVYCSHKSDSALAAGFWPLAWPFAVIYMLVFAVWDLSSDFMSQWADRVVNKKEDE